MWNGKLYLSSREGVFQLDPVTNHFTFLFKPESYCINFDIDAEGNFYANQADKVVIVPLSDVTQRSTLKLQDMGYKGSISHVRVTKDGAYICTLGSGLLFYDRNIKKMIVYNTENSTLPSNYCYNVKQTASNKFILTGDRGIILLIRKSSHLPAWDRKKSISRLRSFGIAGFMSLRTIKSILEIPKGLLFWQKKNFMLPV